MYAGFPARKRDHPVRICQMQRYYGVFKGNEQKKHEITNSYTVLFGIECVVERKIMLKIIVIQAK